MTFNEWLGCGIMGAIGLVVLFKVLEGWLIRLLMWWEGRQWK
jgi:hypothetical protein